jgi:2-oxoisovalerate dehydrogenase E1 component alpha subunit
MLMTSTALPITLIRDLYARMLLTRIVDDHVWRLCQQGHIDFIASCRGYEAAQIGSAFCIEVGKDFTLPSYRDLGVVLTIGMTPYEVFRTCLSAHRQCRATGEMDYVTERASLRHWGYHKHNTVTGPAPVATQLLHAAGIAFASKLRKAPVVTVAYCDNEATTEADFLEAIRFASLHQLPVVFICEQDAIRPYPDASLLSPTLSSIKKLTLPMGLDHQHIDGSDVVTVYTTMHSAMQRARLGHGPTLIEMHVTRSMPDLSIHTARDESKSDLFIAREANDPLVRCQCYLQAQMAWDEEWAKQLCTRISADVEGAWRDAVHDTIQQVIPDSSCGAWNPIV